MDEIEEHLGKLSRRPVVEFAITAAERAIAVVRDQERIMAAVSVARASLDAERLPANWAEVARRLGLWADVVPMLERAGVRAAYHALIASTSTGVPVTAAINTAFCAREAADDAEAESTWQRDALNVAVFVDTWRSRPYRRGRPSSFAIPESKA
jgi:hypothetical protein